MTQAQALLVRQFIEADPKLKRLVEALEAIETEFAKVDHLMQAYQRENVVNFCKFFSDSIAFDAVKKYQIVEKIKQN